MAKGKRKIVLVVHDVRSALNVGSLLRTADGLGIDEVFLTRYTPYPEVSGDSRLPHVRLRATKQIRKTALGAEDSLRWSYRPDVIGLIKELKKAGYQVAALEQAQDSINLTDFITDKNIAVIVGSEVGGIEKNLLKIADFSLEIPMSGRKESFNVAVAGAIALYQLRWHNKG